MTLIELRDALRKATHGTFALECEIGRLIDGWTGEYGPPRNYTVSIDAAVTLLEKGSFFASNEATAPHRGWAHFRVLSEGYAEEVMAATPALALCLARVEYEIARAKVK